MFGSMAVMAGLVILGGLFPNWVVRHLAEPAVDAMLQPSAYIGAVLSGVTP
jgi:formate hydrogenlyase subunit 3/multisubunit Na+/H+ antiporter MnhD subunit